MGAASGILQYIEYAVTYEYAIGHTVMLGGPSPDPPITR